MNNTPATELIELVHERNNKHRPPIGVVLATVINVSDLTYQGPAISVGWSRAHSKLEEFDKEKGIRIARNRALNPIHPEGTRNGCVPNYVDVKLEAMKERAKRYFKGLPFIFKREVDF